MSRPNKLPLDALLEGAYGKKALEILLAMVRLAADGKSLTIAEDWGVREPVAWAACGQARAVMGQALQRQS